MIEWEEVVIEDKPPHPMRTQWRGVFYGRTLAISGREGAYSVWTGTTSEDGKTLRKVGLPTIQAAKDWAQERYGH